VGDVLQVIQSVVVLLAAPLYAGVLARAAAIVQCKRGPSVLQPYRDLRKLLRKGSATSDQASWIFRGRIMFVLDRSRGRVEPARPAPEQRSRRSPSG
jgi:formate hydrogenlyase subunit 4